MFALSKPLKLDKQHEVIGGFYFQRTKELELRGEADAISSHCFIQHMFIEHLLYA